MKENQNPNFLKMADLVEKALAMPNVIEESWHYLRFHGVSEMVEADWAGLCLIGHVGDSSNAYEISYRGEGYKDPNSFVADIIDVPVIDLKQLVDAHEQTADAGKIIRAIREGTITKLLTEHQ